MNSKLLILPEPSLQSYGAARISLFCVYPRFRKYCTISRLSVAAAAGRISKKPTSEETFPNSAGVMVTFRASR